MALSKLQKLRPPPRRRRPPGVRGVDAVVASMDDRLGVAKKATRRLFDHIFPDHWSFFLGEIALYSFVVLVVTGVFLALYYVPSGADVVYHGPYHLLDGATMSESYRSVMAISFEVRDGLLVRQIHHWAADIFIGAIVIHLCRIFFTGAYRKPRDYNWAIGLTMLLLALFNGYFGYSLPDDMLSGEGVRIGYSILESIPIVGSYLAVFIFHGQFPGDGSWVNRFYILHVFVFPGLIVALLGLHLFLIFHQEHTQWPGEHKTEENVVGSPLLPTFMAKTTGLFFSVAGVLTVLGGTVQIDPIWLNGPYVVYKAADAAQPDWYMGWLEGSLREMPSWEWTGFGHTFPFMIFLPAVFLPLATFALLYAVPALDRWLTGDYAMHNLCTPPRDRPWHTAFGASAIAFYFMLLFAGGDDVLSHWFDISLNALVWALRVAQFVIPGIVFVVAYHVCRSLSRQAQTSAHATRPARVRLTAEGYYQVEVQAAGDGSGSLAPIEPPHFLLPPEGAAADLQDQLAAKRAEPDD